MLAADTGLVFLAYYFAHLIRFEGAIPEPHLSGFFQTVIWIVLVKLFFFCLFELYKGMWRYTSIHDLENLLKACLASSAFLVIAILITYQFKGFARSVFIIDFMLTFLFVGGFRIGIRLVHARLNVQFRNPSLESQRFPDKKLLLIGAGDAGEKLLREIFENPHLRYDVVGIIDDDPAKIHKTIHGVPILGVLNDMGQIVTGNPVDEVIIAIPSATAADMRRMVNFCESTAVTYKTVPGLGELIDGRVSVNAVREVRYEDLLGREPVELELHAIGAYLSGKRVLVSGGAGSIGSEICRQIAPFGPESLIIVDRNESGLYEAELDLRAEHPDLNTTAALVPVQNPKRMAGIFERHQPQVVFHAAAYKHVPLMELHPCEAVFNNIVASKTLLDLCQRHKVARCVVVSTDKAVCPTNVMGASKRVIEQLMQSYGQGNGTRFMAVRFGNVIGSIGSVVPLFKKQIARGGPVTVTDRKMTRFFMTIPEAVGLILQAGAIGEGGEIFVLKMGTPVRIIDMARDLITLSGFVPEKEIQIKYIGLRPGEKLYEELITADEKIQKTGHKDIMVLNAECCRPQEEINRCIQTLIALAKVENNMGIKQELQKMVPEYIPEPA